MYHQGYGLGTMTLGSQKLRSKKVTGVRQIEMSAETMKVLMNHIIYFGSYQ